MKKLAASSGVVIYEAENKLYISKEPGNSVGTLLFVTGVLAFILLGNGILQLTVFKNQLQSPSKTGIFLIATGLVFALIFWRIWLYQKKQTTVPLQQLKTICLFDFNSNMLLDSQQNILAPITQVWLTRKMQLTSSSPALMLQWNRGSLCIAKGNPFSGGVAAIEKVLLSKGIRKR